MKLDLDLLKRLLVIDHASKEEWPMISFLINECYKIGGLEFSMDHYANIFITKNTTDPEYYPAVIAHMDCVIPSQNKKVKIKDGVIYGRNKLTGKPLGLGADDSVGICLAIQLLKVIPDLKVCFTTEEEVGFIGASVAAENTDFFYNVSYMIQADRHGDSDLITYTNCIYSASEEWLRLVTPIAASYGYSEEIGIGTDVGELAEKLQLSGVNLSCGYYDEHRNSEKIVIKETEKCLNFMHSILTSIPIDKQYEIKIDYRAYYDYPRDDTPTYIEEGKNYYDDTEWELPCDTCKDCDCMHCTKSFF